MKRKKLAPQINRKMRILAFQSAEERMLKPLKDSDKIIKPQTRPTLADKEYEQ